MLKGREKQKYVSVAFEIEACGRKLGFWKLQLCLVPRRDVEIMMDERA